MEKMKIYKNGYTAGIKVHRLDIPASGGRHQDAYNTFCFKAFAAERRPDSLRAQGFNQRTVELQCTRTISTKITQCKQKTVFSREEALARFKQANGLDCRIAAYHSTNWRKGLCKSVSPDFLFMDLDLGTLATMEKLDKALTNTLVNIKEKLGGVPSVIWSGGGYHVYQPVSRGHPRIKKMDGCRQEK